MKRIDIKLADAFYIENQSYTDSRGYFLTSYRKQDFPNDFVQDHESMSMFGVIRGLHYQKPPYSQAKLIRVLRGEIMDVIVDIRSDSPTFGKSFSIFLNEDNKYQLYVPRGFAHGFISLQNNTLVQYKIDNIYRTDFEAGIRYNDPDLNIDWIYKKDIFILSEKDKVLPLFKETKFYTKIEHQQNAIIDEPRSI